MLMYLLYTVLFILLFQIETTIERTTGTALSTRFCVSISNTLRARHKTCFLRPDTGPCRADIIQWYFDARQAKCYRFFWGGCQGNGNRFEKKEDCVAHCWINGSSVPDHLPYFCELQFDYGNCFGHYERWSYDKLFKTCKRQIYSGCGGNQNNFETLEECYRNCLTHPNNTLTHNQFNKFTTCIPLDVPELNRRRRKRRR